jgi:outer membrane receptor protein involved in Fe transport
MVAACWVALAGAQSVRPDKTHLYGTVVDPSGAVVGGANVVVTSPGCHAATTSASDGHFDIPDVPCSEGVLAVEAAGFATHRQAWGAASRSPVVVVLDVAAVAQEVSVTATRTQLPISDTAANVKLFSHAELATMGGVTLDDVLRQVPGFTLFRRSGSLTANPTSQGVSLRGLGASGASRALLLYDGVPLNDPFGGWVYWSRVPVISISSLEMMEGGASDLYGTDALSGVINILARPPTEDVIAVDASAGSLTTADGSLFAAKQLHNWGASVTADSFHSDGYIVVRDQDRGTVDTPAASEHRTGSISLDRRFSGSNHGFIRGSVFEEARNNGTQLQVNSTHIGALAAGADLVSSLAGSFTTRVYFNSQRYLQTFSSIAAGRNSEALVRSQTVPAERLGFSEYWTRPVHHAQTLVAGVEVQDTRGHSNELIYTGGRATTRADSGGRQTVVGVFGEDLIRIGPRWLITAGFRVDRWANYDAFQNTFPLQSGTATMVALPDRVQTAFSPRLSVRHQWNRNLSLAASAYRSFRAPTLNELYRSFRLGNVNTLANANLTAERMTGGEASAIANAANNRLAFRGTFFWAEVDNPVANVTLSATPLLITRQRQNLGLTRSRGVEASAEFRASSRWKISAAYQFVNASVVSFPADTTLQGLAIPQVPQHQFSSELRYDNAKAWTFVVQPRFVASQYDDDRNQLPLGSFFTMDGFASRRINRFVELYAAAENLFDQRYTVGRTPNIVLGPPIIARGGIRLQFSTR